MFMEIETNYPSQKLTITLGRMQTPPINRTHFGKGSKNQVLRVSGKATLMPDMSGE